jgi:predicted GIY-YIG superfamily endonuclease
VIETANGERVETLAVSLRAARGAVYVVQHVESGRCYVGMTRRSVARRWGDHRRLARFGAEQHFARALRLYGADAFQVHVVASGLTDQEAGAVERALIEQLDTMNARFGFNESPGGEQPTHGDAAKARIGAAARARWAAPAYRERLRAAQAQAQRDLGADRKADAKRRMWDTRRAIEAVLPEDEQAARRAARSAIASKAAKAGHMKRAAMRG